MSGQNKLSENEIAAVVHDVRQMLAVITGRTGLLNRTIDGQVAQDSLSVIASAAEQANATLSRLLDPAKAQNSGSCDVFQALLQSSRLIQPKPGMAWQSGPVPSNKKDGSWHLGVNLERGCFTTIASTILLEVLNNLLRNALDAMPDGGQLTTHMQRVGEYWHLRLQDSGPGIPEDRRDHIFELGFSTSGDEARGIGLSSCRDLLVVHGGNLKLMDSSLGGACFELILPFTPTKPESPLETTCEQEVHFRPSILVVDDDEGVREMLQDVLVELGCQVKVARDAPDAAEIFPSEPFEMVIIDQTLPGMSGLEFAGELRQQHPQLVLVLISGWGQEEVLDKALGSVVDLVGEKPITVDKIIEMLNQAGVLRNHRLERS